MIDYMQIPLKPFQEILAYQFSKCTTGIMVATRGIGKSFFTAAFGCAIAILYPNSDVVICCSTKEQAKKVITNKIQNELCGMSPTLKAEIKDYVKTDDGLKVVFKNGSTLLATNASDNRRGIRSTLLIVDESVWVDKVVLEKVLIPFLTTPRRRGYLSNPEYADYIEYENKMIFLTSAWYKTNWFYENYYLKNIRNMIKPTSLSKSFVINFGSKTSLRNNLITEAKLQEFKETLDKETYDMEIEGIFYGENATSLFKVDEISSCMTLEDAFYPPTITQYITERDTGVKTFNFTEKDNELRILSADIALSAGKLNDNSIYSLMRTYPSGKIYKKELNYMESHNGLSAESQALRIKQLFYDYKCHRMVIDAHGIGYTVYNELKKETYDNERGVTYPA